MNRRGGLFTPVILLFLCVVLIYVWSVIVPAAYAPAADSTISDITGSPNADGTIFVIKMIPWAVPIILVLGFMWLMFGGGQ